MRPSAILVGGQSASESQMGVGRTAAALSFAFFLHPKPASYEIRDVHKPEGLDVNDKTLAAES